jgi:hypothetical protein
MMGANPVADSVTVRPSPIGRPVMEVLPPRSTNLLVQAVPTVTPISREEQQQHNLLLHQMIRATIQEGGQEKALLQFGDRRLWVETGASLKAGDTLNLQVVKTQPNLAFKIIEPNLLERLGHSLHLLGNRLDTLTLLPAILEGREPGSNDLGPKVRDGLAQLLTLLQKAPNELDGSELSALPKRLGLYHEADLLDGRPQDAEASLKNVLGQLGVRQEQLRGQLMTHLEPLYATLTKLPEFIQISTQSASSLNQQAEGLSAVLRPLLRLAEATPEKVYFPTGVPTDPGATAPAQPVLSRPDVAAEITTFVNALREYLQPFAELTDEALKRIEQQAALLPQIQHGLFEPALAAIGRKALGKDLLGALFHLLRAAPDKLAGSSGASLSKQIVEALQKSVTLSINHIVERQEETLRQVELWQLCRARLGDIDTSFIPLPLPFIENGFLLARRQQSPDPETAQPEEIVTLSLFLDLQKLGPLQVDLLYQKKELFIRFKCRNQGVADTLSAARKELGTALGDLPLSSISVGLGAEDPDRALIRKLIPSEKNLLDTRA